MTEALDPVFPLPQAVYKSRTRFPVIDPPPELIIPLNTGFAAVVVEAYALFKFRTTLSVIVHVVDELDIPTTS
jgi:hypothetical protein